MGEIKVERKGYWRKEYTYTRNGKQINVKRTWIPESTYKTEDRGKPGKTPESEKWFTPEVKTGWMKTQLPSERRNKLLEATDKSRSMHDRYVQAGRMIQELANVTSDKATKNTATDDADYFFMKAKEIK